MSKRGETLDGQYAESKTYGLVYTRKCGWIDLGHANPTDAASLWRDVVATQTGRPPAGYSRLKYRQSMSKFGMTDSVSRQYDVKGGLTLPEQRSVALAIFLDVSIAFETLQSNWLYRHLTDSGFSAEDLVSDLVGFYRAVLPGPKYVQQCDPVSQKEALAIWDKFGPVGSLKNGSPSPYLFSIDPITGAGTATCGTLPPFLDSIDPAAKGTLFRDVP